eukprot:329943-Pleurochrysis_carterae.AAC.1
MKRKRRIKTIQIRIRTVRERVCSQLRDRSHTRPIVQTARTGPSGAKCEFGFHRAGPGRPRSLTLAPYLL